MNIKLPEEIPTPHQPLAGFNTIAVPDMVRLTSFVGNAEISVYLDPWQADKLADVLTRRDGTPFVGAKKIKLYRLREAVQ